MMQFYKDIKLRDDPMILRLLLKAVSKERPRVGAAGHIYTPPKTQKFEKYIAEAAKTLMRAPYTCPVRVNIMLYEPVPKSYKGDKREAAELGLISPPVGDLDNKVKAITDGLNGIVYIDDKQINCLRAERAYGEEHSIFVQIERNGLSSGELEKYGRERSNRRRA